MNKKTHDEDLEKAVLSVVFECSGHGSEGMDWRLRKWIGVFEGWNTVLADLQLNVEHPTANIKC